MPVSKTSIAAAVFGLLAVAPMLAQTEKPATTTATAAVTTTNPSEMDGGVPQYLKPETPEERMKIESILHHRAFNGVSHAEILEILQRYGSLEAAADRAAMYAESARAAICTFPDSEIKRALLWAPEFVVAREK